MHPILRVAPWFYLALVLGGFGWLGYEAVQADVTGGRRAEYWSERFRAGDDIRAVIRGSADDLTHNRRRVLIPAGVSALGGVLLFVELRRNRRQLAEFVVGL